MQKGSALALACRPLVFSGVWRSRPPGGGSLWGPGLGPLYALDKLVRACASSPKISWGGHQILPSGHEGVSCSLQFPLCACARPTRLSGLCVSTRGDGTRFGTSIEPFNEALVGIRPPPTGPYNQSSRFYSL